MSLRKIFSRYGSPVVLKSDNGPAYSSMEFKDFAKTYGFEHITSSPRYSQSMGFIEKNVQICKNLLKKAKKSNSDPYLALLEFRNTPIENVHMSPSQMLMGRRTRTQIPVNESLLNPKYDASKVRAALKKKQQVQKQYYDQGAKPLLELNPGDQIRVRNENSWEPGMVESKANTPRTYNIQTDKGQLLRRNRRHLMKTTENRISEPEIFYDCQEEVNSDKNSVSDKNTSNSVSQNDTRKFTSSGREVKMPKKYDDFVMK